MSKTTETYMQAVKTAIKNVKSRFPTPEIIDQTEETIKNLAQIVGEFSQPPGRLLDIGCGALDKTMVFSQLGYHSHGCDDFKDPWHTNPANLGPVLELASSFGVEVYAQDDGYSVPWEKGTFDVVTMVNVIEHLVESPREILNFAGDYLRTGGLLVVAMPNSVNLRKRISVLLGKSNYTPVRGFYEYAGPWRGHIREFTPGETRDIVEWTGFEVLKTKTFHGMLGDRLGNPVLRQIFRLVCNVVPNYRDSVVVVARKPEGWVHRQPDPNAMQDSLSQDLSV
jgi:SAM-dependent methyltransferase